MEEMILESWQPVTNLERNGVCQTKLEISGEGLTIHLEDLKGNQVRVLYDQMSQIHDHVWTFRYTGEGPRNNLVKLMQTADARAVGLKRESESFYKVKNSDLIRWFDQLPWMGSQEYPNVEHHLYFTMNEVFEVVADYEPKFIYD
ncbi:hypothetical protein [Bhargavaea cecembensis]|uniref:hypothetical protein n=1 Tax=Bhargavaea cecembensis TaxID=394098 RepID=UPI00059046CD|nr:hypothetical protein [Bhargavaea cecembensis]